MIEALQKELDDVLAEMEEYDIDEEIMDYGISRDAFTDDEDGQNAFDLEFKTLEEDQALFLRSLELQEQIDKLS